MLPEEPVLSEETIFLLSEECDEEFFISKYFDEIYTGPIFIAEKILLSHEPIHGLQWCLNIHGHDHNQKEPYVDGCKYLNLAANMCGYTPFNLGKAIKEGILSDVPSLHRITIDGAIERKANESTTS